MTPNHNKIALMRALLDKMPLHGSTGIYEFFNQPQGMDTREFMNQCDEIAHIARAFGYLRKVGHDHYELTDLAIRERFIPTT